MENEGAYWIINSLRSYETQQILFGDHFQGSFVIYILEKQPHLFKDTQLGNFSRNIFFLNVSGTFFDFRITEVSVCPVLTV